MNVGLPREIFINDKPERFTLIALVYWDAVFMTVHCVLITINSFLAILRINLLALSQRSIYFRSLLIWDSRSGIVQ